MARALAWLNKVLVIRAASRILRLAIAGRICVISMADNSMMIEMAPGSRAEWTTDYEWRKECSECDSRTTPLEYLNLRHWGSWTTE